MIADATAVRPGNVVDVRRRPRWQIERDLVRGRAVDYSKPFLPQGLSLVNELSFLSHSDARFLSQVQGRTYAHMFSLVERFMSTKALGMSSQHWLGEEAARALANAADDKLKHQELFLRLDAMMAQMPAGYIRAAHPNDLARAVAGKSPWAVLVLALVIERSAHPHYRASIAPDESTCEVWRDVFEFHWREESQHAVLDELELTRADAQLGWDTRDRAMEDWIAIIMALDRMLQAQSQADAGYFCDAAESPYSRVQRAEIQQKLLKAYRWQYITSGMRERRFQRTLFALLDEYQSMRIKVALDPLTRAVPRAREARQPLRMAA